MDILLSINEREVLTGRKTERERGTEEGGTKEVEESLVAIIHHCDPRCLGVVTAAR